jgi:PelA/Pel-15E family pectate lyase
VRKTGRLAGFTAATWLLLSACSEAASAPRSPWNEALSQPPAWYGSDAAVRVADNVLLYQRQSGGWPKNLDMARALSEKEAAEIAAQKRASDATIDNGATYTQLALLAKVHESRKLERHRQAFLRGMDYLLEAQYANGGWPQFYPLLPGYYSRITYNDNAMTGVLELLREVARAARPYSFVDEARRLRAARAVAGGVECILRSQVVVNGRRSVWCAQHDEVTLAPASARSYELVSLSGFESVAIVRFLMGLENPDARTRDAIDSAVAWFEESKLTGIRVVDRRVAAGASGFERVVASDPAAPPLWARFYEIGTNRPIFAGRDGVVRYSLAEIEEERRNNYRWYVDAPAKLLAQDYPRWRDKWRVAAAVVEKGAPAQRLSGLSGLENVGQVAPGLYRGSAPEAQGVLTLKKLGIRTVVNLRHFHGSSEERALRSHGIGYERIVLESSDAPSDADVRRFLEIVTDPGRRPVYFHCWRGKDRTGAMCAAYRMAIEGWSLEDARNEMHAFGFYKGWRDLARFVDGFAARASSFRPAAPRP